MKKQFLIYFLVTGLIACTKFNDPISPIPTVPEKATAGLKSTRSFNANGHYILQKYLYTHEGKLDQQISLDEATGQQITQLYSYINGKLFLSDISSGAKKLSKIDYVSSAEILTKMRYSSYDPQGNPELNFERTLEFKDGKIYKISTIHPDGTLGEFTIFTLEAGNVTAISLYAATGVLLNSYSYGYDEKKNPFIGHPGQNQSPNGYSKSNIIKVTHIDHLNNNTISHRSYVYDYNPQGQPIAQYMVNTNNQRILQMNYTY